MLAYAMLFPDREILFMFIFPLKVKYVVMILAAINFLFALQGRSGVSYVAHLGGFLVGWLYFQMRYKRSNFDPVALVQGRYKEWKLQRARRKFQVYMNKMDRDRRQ
jgi:membrane associated rhomboid family serine protease